MARAVAPPFLVALNLTRRCNLRCTHCYLDAGTRRDGDADELSSGEIEAVLDDIASLDPGTMVVLTGGEPILRPDIERLARYAADLGLMVVVGTNGVLLNEARVERLKAAGVQGVGISLDSLRPEFHDRFRGVSGVWEKTMASLDACRRAGLGFQVHFSVTDDNAFELDDMIDFARAAGAFVLNVFFLVCTGRGEKVTNISRETYESVLRRVTEAAHEEGDILIRAKCAPHFKRMALELDASWPITLAHGYEAGGCLAGTRYCRVTPEGEVTPCPFMELSVGSVRHRRFVDIWRDSPLFDQLRQPKLEGRCGICEYRRMCGGCRARPLARSGELMGEDFLCGYEPQGGAMIEPLPDMRSSVTWSANAERRLSRVPPFLRKMVRQRTEEYVTRGGRSRVTETDMRALVRKRFGDTGPPRPPTPPANRTSGNDC